MIEVASISKSFGDKKVLDDISCRFESGQVNLIIGQSGMGKTVLMKCTVGLFEVDEGMVSFDGRNFSTMDFRERKPIRQEIGMVFQGGALFDSLSVEENVMFPLNMFTAMSLSEKRDRADACLRRVNLKDVHKKYPSEISGGMKKRVAIARAIAMNPRYLFCDEPNSGLDPKTSIVIDELIREITEEFKTTTVVNTHDMNSLTEIGQHVVFIHNGRKWWEGSCEDILNSGNAELDSFVFATKVMQRLKH
jgi:phospholipid/cholesterol/gamma-HCH transport system ATP-binding protein